MYHILKSTWNTKYIADVKFEKFVVSSQSDSDPSVKRNTQNADFPEVTGEGGKI